MYTLLIIIVVIAAILLIGIVLLQESKGGGLTAQFNDYKKIIGVNKSDNLVEKATWILIAIIVVCCVVCSLVLS